jgi:hypothetical protein
MAQKPWEKDKESLEWYKAAAREVYRQAVQHPEIPIPVDPDVAEFMGATKDPNAREQDFYPSKAYLDWLKKREEDEKIEATKAKKAEGIKLVR